MSIHRTNKSLVRRYRQAVRRFHRDEEGAAYTLSYVMVIPVYALVMCAIVELALLLTAKLGTTYSAYAAARTASVWSSSTSWEKTKEKAKQAAIKTMVPFSSGTQPLLNSADPESLPEATKYVAAYHIYAKHKVPTKYLFTKYGYAARHTELLIEGPPKTWNANIEATVSYEFPFHVPGIGRLFGKRGLDGRYYLKINSTVSLPNEGPQNDRNTIGIGYGKLD